MLLQISETAQQAISATEMASNAANAIPIWDLALKGGWIMIPIVLLLLISVYIFIERIIILNRAGKEQTNFMESIRDYVYNNRIDSAIALCERTRGPVARMIEKGLFRIGKPLNDINAAIENVGKLEVAKLEKNLSWISTSAGAAPMIGFLGTVVGMVRVFFNISSKGNNIEVGLLADGMYQAMITTVAGLIVGIIAYVCYNYLVARVERMVYNFEAKTTEFMDLLNEPVKE